MGQSSSPFRLATRGSPLARAQTALVLGCCRAAFPRRAFDIQIIKTSGDRLQTASLAQPDANLPKGLFTKELELAVLGRTADLAVHSLKDLPTELPDGLRLGAVLERADPRDVLIYRLEGARPGSPRGFPPGRTFLDLPLGACVATGSTRRAAQLRLHRPDLRLVEIRGNVGTRLQKVAAGATLDATLLAAAGLARLGLGRDGEGRLTGADAPSGLCATVLPAELMLPCAGQAAIGLEIRRGDRRAGELCRRLNHPPTFACVTAERAFLAALGGGCQSPVAALAEYQKGRIRLSARVLDAGRWWEGERSGAAASAEGVGSALAAECRAALDSQLPAIQTRRSIRS